MGVRAALEGESPEKQEVSFLTGTQSSDLHFKQGFTYTLLFLKAAGIFGHTARRQQLAVSVFNVK